VGSRVDDVLREALQLSELERAQVAGGLLASLDPNVEIRDSDAWIAEVERRAQTAGLDWDEVRLGVEQRLARK
jgi:hypothetical protein